MKEPHGILLKDICHLGSFPSLQIAFSTSFLSGSADTVLDRVRWVKVEGAEVPRAGRGDAGEFLGNRCSLVLSFQVCNHVSPLFRANSASGAFECHLRHVSRLWGWREGGGGRQWSDLRKPLSQRECQGCRGHGPSGREGGTWDLGPFLPTCCLCVWLAVPRCWCSVSQNSLGPPAGGSRPMRLKNASTHWCRRGGRWAMKLRGRYDSSLKIISMLRIPT